jgi:hypothetical protein
MFVTAVSATPPWPNPGMASVDLALHALFLRHRLPAELRFVQLYTPAERNPDITGPRRERLERRHELPFRYGPFHGHLEEACAGAALLYWGDFFHSRDYLRQCAGTLLQIGAATGEDEALREVYRHFFLAEAPAEALSRTVAFGGTMIFNRIRDYQDPAYAGALARLVRGARGIWMRDIYSALRVAGLRGEEGIAPLGVDASLLLRDEDLELLPRSAGWGGGEPAATAGVFFGRTAAGTRRLGRFARDLCRELGVAGEWLPWFDPSMRPNHLEETQAGFPALRVAEGHQDPPLLGDVLSRLGRYAFVVTDTYHVCLNAWRAGVPAVCIGDALPNPAGYDVSTGWFGAWRDKRHVFYSMHDAMEFYLFREELAGRTAYANRLFYTAHLLREQSVARAVVADLHAGRAAAERQLVAALQDLLAAGPR